MWTQNKLFQPQNPIPEKQHKPRHRHNHEHLVVLARSISGRQYLAEMMQYRDRSLVADDIATGQVYDAVSVFALNPVEGWAKDISEEIAQAILDKFGFTRSSRDFIEDHLAVYPRTAT